MEQILSLDITERDACLACYTLNETGLSQEWREFLFCPFVNDVSDTFPSNVDRDDMIGLFLDLVVIKSRAHGLEGRLNAVAANEIQHQRNADKLIRMADERGIDLSLVNLAVADACSVPGDGRVLVIDQRYEILIGAVIDLSGERPVVERAHLSDYGWGRFHRILLKLMTAGVYTVCDQFGLDSKVYVKQARKAAVSCLGRVLSGGMKSIGIGEGDERIEVNVPYEIINTLVPGSTANLLHGNMGEAAVIDRDHFLSADRVVIAGTNDAMRLVRDKVLTAVPEVAERTAVNEPWDGTLLGAARYGLMLKKGTEA